MVLNIIDIAGKLNNLYRYSISLIKSDLILHGNGKVLYAIHTRAYSDTKFWGLTKAVYI